MNFVFKILAFGLCLGLVGVAEAKSLEDFVRKAAKRNGLIELRELNEPFNPELAKIGETVFNSKALSLNGGMSCQSCHLDKFGSADGIPNAIGVGGKEDGKNRVLRGGAVVPRNTLPLWGRGSSRFRTFFWDGKVDFSYDNHISQFGAKRPTNDPLIIAILLPVVEIREMLAEDNFVRSHKRENISGADEIYSAVLKKLRTKHPSEFNKLAALTNKSSGEDVEFIEVASAIKDFFRQKFAVKPYRFNEFVFNDGKLSKAELAGAALFYGKGKCVVCHSGPFFSDLFFHVIPFRQLGSGKNGFGVDYGRFNVTHDPNDLYKFRTPPLLNVSKTAPYGHSGSVATLFKAINLHFDPLKGLKIDEMDSSARIELYKRLAASSQALHTIPTLDEKEVGELEAFLNTLSF
jgi:cytochrome c peroxidase